HHGALDDLAIVEELHGGIDGGHEIVGAAGVGDGDLGGRGLAHVDEASVGTGKETARWTCRPSTEGRSVPGPHPRWGPRRHGARTDLGKPNSPGAVARGRGPAPAPPPV